MNQIKTIAAQNIKGQTFRHDLAPVTLFTGDNFSGKTSRLDAVHLALLGWVPGVSKRPSDIHADLASGAEMGVTAILDDREIGRTWRKSGDSVKYLDMSGGLEFPPVALVASEFLSLSPAERVKFLFARATLPPEYSAEAVRQTVCANVKNIKLEDNTVESEKAIADLVTFVLGRQSVASAQEYVTNLAIEVNEKKKLAVQNVQRMEKTQQGMIIVAPDTQAESSAEAKLKAAQESYTAQRSVLAQVEAEGKRLGAELEALKRTAAGAMPDESAARAELQRISDAKQAAAKNCLNAPNSRQFDAEFESITSELAKAESARASAAAWLDEASKQRDSLKSDKNACCKACGQSLKKLRDSLLEAAEKSVVDAYTDHSREKNEAASLAEHAEHIKAKRAKLAAEVKEFNDAQASFRKLSEEHAVLQKKLENNSAASTAALSVPALENKLTELRNRFKEVSDSCDGKDAEVDASNDAYKQLLAQRARIQQQQAALDELKRSRVEAEVLKAAVAMLLDLQAILVKIAVAPLLSKANQLCGDLLPSPLAYKDGDIGFGNDGSFYSHRSFSGTEKALAYAAISVALSQGAPIRLVVIDELGRLTPANKARLILKLCELTKRGELDQALLVDVTPASGFTSDQFKLIEL